MKYLFYTFINFFIYLNLQSQNCLPDSIYKDSTAGVYPKPISPTNPNGGIHKKACINKPFEFTFTVVVPDSVTVPNFPTLGLEKVSIDTQNAIKNLPKGIHYKCNPPNCIYQKNTFGCLILSGIPTTDNTPGDFKPVISLNLTLNFGIPFDYAAEYPGSVFPGEYILSLQSETDCSSSSNEEIAPVKYWYPNPGNGYLYHPSNHLLQVKIFDMQGIPVFENSTIRDAIDLRKILHPGIYIIQWIENQLIYNQKLSIRNTDF